MKELTEQETRAFADAMLEKQLLAHGWELPATPPNWPGDDIREVLKNIILNVVIDTEMMLNGQVPLEKWLSKTEDVPFEDWPAEYWESQE